MSNELTRAASPARGLRALAVVLRRVLVARFDPVTRSALVAWSRAMGDPDVAPTLRARLARACAGMLRQAAAEGAERAEDLELITSTNPDALLEMLDDVGLSSRLVRPSESVTAPWLPNEPATVAMASVRRHGAAAVRRVLATPGLAALPAVGDGEGATLAHWALRTLPGVERATALAGHPDLWGRRAWTGRSAPGHALDSSLLSCVLDATSRADAVRPILLAPGAATAPEAWVPFAVRQIGRWPHLVIDLVQQHPAHLTLCDGTGTSLALALQRQLYFQRPAPGLSSAPPRPDTLDALVRDLTGVRLSEARPASATAASSVTAPRLEPWRHDPRFAAALRDSGALMHLDQRLQGRGRSRRTPRSSRPPSRPCLGSWIACTTPPWAPTRSPRTSCSAGAPRPCHLRALPPLPPRPRRVAPSYRVGWTSCRPSCGPCCRRWRWN